MKKLPIVFAYIGGVLTVLTGVVTAQTGGTWFPDVPSGAYFTEAVEYFARTAIVKGYSSGLFGPHDPVTRGQVAVLLQRYDEQTIDPLRKQVEQIRAELGLGFCGDGRVQTGEQCDDGNGYSEDGCSAECLREIRCPGGYKIGDAFPDTDGCNTCTCTEAGIICTERACEMKKCFTSAECSSGEVCSVELGDCRFPCPAGATCIQACAGVCIAGKSPSQCGNGQCESDETGVPDRTGERIYCPQDCAVGNPICGNALCEDGEADEYGLGSEGPELLRRGTCPSDCEGGNVCQKSKDAIDAYFADNLRCVTDDDCAVFIRSCGPYQTCGKPIASDALLDVTRKVLDYVSECGDQEEAQCVACTQKTVRCIENRCSL